MILFDLICDLPITDAYPVTDSVIKLFDFVATPTDPADLSGTVYQLLCCHEAFADRLLRTSIAHYWMIASVICIVLLP